MFNIIIKHSGIISCIIASSGAQYVEKVPQNTILEQKMALTATLDWLESIIIYRVNIC